MSFAARQRQLMDRLRWAPTRGPKRQALLAQLQQLVRDELRREISGAKDRRLDLFDRTPVNPPPAAYQRPGREPYWMM